VVAESAIGIIMSLTFRIGTAMLLVQLNISLPLGDLSDFDAVLVSLVCKPLDVPVVEVVDAQDLQTDVSVVVADVVNLLKDLLVLQKHLEVLLVEANARIVLWNLNINLGIQRSERVLHALQLHALSTR